MRRIKNTKATVNEIEVEILSQRIIISGQIKDEVTLIEDNNVVRSIESTFSFNHAFPAATAKLGLLANGSIDVEHITTTLLGVGKQIAKDYLLAITVIIEGQARKITERFLLHHISNLPYPSTKTKIIYKPKKSVVEKKEPSLNEIVLSLEKEIEKRLTDIVDNKIQETIQSVKIEIQNEEELKKEIEQQQEQTAKELKKERILNASKKQKYFGYSTRKKENKGG